MLLQEKFLSVAAENPPQMIIENRSTWLHVLTFHCGMYKYFFYFGRIYNGPSKGYYVLAF